MDFIDSIAGQIPALAASTQQKRAARGAGNIKGIPSAAELRARWATDVCQGDVACIGLLK
jgi:hypothetical protein